jgi:hypothetical protein
MTPYFYVFRPGHSFPTVRHETYALALAEATRLAEKHPGHPFEILRCISITSTLPALSSKSPFGHTNPERDKREMCPYCYNETPRRMVGIELIPYEAYHVGAPFKAFECEACRATYHFSTIKTFYLDSDPIVIPPNPQSAIRNPQSAIP